VRNSEKKNEILREKWAAIQIRKKDGVGGGWKEGLGIKGLC